MIMLEEMDVNLPTDKLYHLLLDYFTSQLDIKVKHCLEPSLIEVGMGSWTSFRGNPPGSVKIKIRPKSEKTSIDFDFNFVSWFVTWFTIAVIVFFICFPFGIQFWLPQIIVTVIVLAFIMPQDRRTAKKKFMDRVSDLIAIK